MKSNHDVKFDIPQSAQFHLNMVQSIIQRMSSNSTSCKAWCITLVSALLVLLSEHGDTNYAFITCLPIFLFFVLDTYYLSLEKRFRMSYDSFINRLHNGKLRVKDLYAITPGEEPIKHFLHSAKSPSVWPFYLTLFVLVLWVRFFIIT